MKNNYVFRSLLMIFLLLFSFPIHAQTSDAEKTNELKQTTVDEAGITPDSPIHNLELVYEGMQLFFAGSPETESQLALGFSEERLAELNVMLHSENYAAVTDAVEELHNSMENLQTAVEKIEPTKENVDLINNIEKEAILNSGEIEQVQTQLEEKVAEKVISQEELEVIPIGRTEHDLVNVQKECEQTKDDFVDLIAQDEGITKIEAEIKLEEIPSEKEVTELQKEEVTNELSDLKQNVENLETQYETLVKQDEFPREVIAEANQIIEESKTNLQISDDSFTHGDYRQAFEHLVAAKDLAFVTEEVLDNSKSTKEVIDLAEQTADDVKEEQDQREEDAREYVSELDSAKEELLQKYPEEAEAIEHNFEIAKRVSELGEKSQGIYQKQFDVLTKEDGKTEEEATKILSERFAQEYRLAYGEEYHPPGVSLYGKLGTENEPSVKTVGGFVKGYDYVDPASGIKYEFTDNGYLYTTPSGITYKESWPEGYTPPKSYENGNEVHQYIEKTPEGSRIYNYLPTGYEVVQPDGTVKAFAYPEGKYEMYGGEKIEIDPTGYKVETKDGEALKYEYSPKFENYIGPGGVVYVPAEGASYHQEEVAYSKDSGTYNYKSPTGESWTYDPGSNNWLSSSGQNYKPEATTVAPVGYEHTGQFESSDGVGWKYDSTTGTWTSSGGQAYNSESGQYHTAEGTTWTYNPTANTWASPTGETHTGGEVGSTPTGTTVTTQSGESWAYDSTTGTWTSSSGQSYSSSTSYSGTTDSGTTGTYTGSYGGHTYSESSGGGGTPPSY